MSPAIQKCVRDDSFLPPPYSPLCRQSLSGVREQWETTLLVTLLALTDGEAGKPVWRESEDLSAEGGEMRTGFFQESEGQFHRR